MLNVWNDKDDGEQMLEDAEAPKLPGPKTSVPNDKYTALLLEWHPVRGRSISSVGSRKDREISSR